MKIGDKFLTTKGEQIEVVNYFGWDEVEVKFASGHVCLAETGQIRKGNVKNPYLPVLHGVGFMGVGSHKSKVSGKKTLTYNTWKSMIERCYSPNSSSYLNYGGKGITVCKDWHNFQNFAEWFVQQPNYGKCGFELDKDMVKIGNKVYCSDYCSILPREINQLTLFKEINKRECKQGVHWSQGNNKFIAQCGINGKQVYLGGYETKEEAYKHYISFKIEYVRQKAKEHYQWIPAKVYENLLNYTGDLKYD